jgi:hypothetical protein
MRTADHARAGLLPGSAHHYRWNGDVDGDNITTATHDEWRAFQASLISANAAGKTEVTF